MTVAIPPGPGSTLTKLFPDRGYVSVKWWEEMRSEQGSPRISYGVDRSACSRDVFCRWQDRSDLARLFVGFSTVVTGPGMTPARYVSRVLPEPFPEEPWLWCSACPATSGLSRKGRSLQDVAAYDVCKLEFSYSALKFRVKPDEAVKAATGPLAGFPDEGLALATWGAAGSRYVTRSRRYAYRVDTLPMGLLGWDNSVAGDGSGTGGDTILQGFPLKTPEIEVQYRWSEVPLEGIPEQAIGLMHFGVNASTFDGFPPETLLYLGCEIEERLSPWGDTIQDVVHRFGARFNYSRVAVGGVYVARGWNWLLRAQEGKPLDYRKVFRKGTNEVLFLPQDFASLFRPDQN